MKTKKFKRFTRKQVVEIFLNGDYSLYSPANGRDMAGEESAECKEHVWQVYSEYETQGKDSMDSEDLRADHRDYIESVIETWYWQNGHMLPS
jgi:hypothetical protein